MVHSYPFKIGAIQAYSIRDGHGEITEKDFEEIMGTHAAALRDTFQHAAPVFISQNVLAFTLNGQKVLIDTGIGGLDPSSPGETHPALAEIGFAPETIDRVIITHFHGDHVGGLFTTDYKAAFPNATLTVPVTEADYWLDPNQLAQMPEFRRTLFQTLLDLYKPRFQKVPAEEWILPGVKYVAAPGHTPGHSAVWIDSEGVQCLHIGDTAHLDLQLADLNSSPTYDVDPILSAQTRHAVVNRIVKESLLVMAYHFPHPGVGHIRHDSTGFHWEPL
jgi:glyoxylase-like metal-dependent hydrolase (beta-lactamase superfamily II)